MYFFVANLDVLFHTLSTISNPATNLELEDHWVMMPVWTNYHEAKAVYSKEEIQLSKWV